MKRIAFDFDDTIVHNGTDKPVSNEMIEFIKQLKSHKDFQLIIETANPDLEHVYTTLKKLGIEPDIVTNTKQSVDIRIDDRCIRFNGDVEQLKRDIINFKHWKL
jgi:hydroxymethylpyrimidine pyrophosphatase-like HAD family hydrolase